MKRKKHYHICIISGFTEKIGELTGMAELYSNLLQYNSHNVTISLSEWNRDWVQYARMLKNIYAKDSELEIIVVGYSWGAGYGFTKLAKELSKLDLSINHAYLIDPIYRSRFILTRWLALIPNIKIKVPSNVKRVVSWTQKRDKLLTGHDLIRENLNTKLIKHKPLKLRHVKIDESKSIHSEIDVDIFHILNNKPI